MLGWQVGLASVCYLTALQIQSFVIMHHPDFVFENWHAALMTVAVAITAVLFNTVLVRLLPHLELIMLVLRKLLQQPLSFIADMGRLHSFLRICIRTWLHGS